jgi:hypothetical protein
MSAAWIFAGVVAVTAVLALWLSWRWLAGSWEVLDDDGLHERLLGGPGQAPGLWVRMNGWIGRKPLRLTYRRDKRGRFRRVRR